MTEYLLSHPDIDPSDTHLHAIRDNQLRIAVMILDKLNDIMSGLEYVGITHSPDFLDDTTPLALAAECGHFEIINMLKLRRHVLQRPHPPSCNCNEVCRVERIKGDIVNTENIRLFMYKAISNPSYICQTEDDPILKAFLLSAELDNAAEFDKEFYPAYKALSHLVQSKWIGNWYEWKVKSVWLKCLAVILQIVLLPIIALIILIAPNSKQAKFYETPVNKFLSSVANYLIFLAFVFLQSCSNKVEQLRGPPNTGYEWILGIYTISYAVAFIQLCIVDGPVRCFRSRRNWYDLAMIILFILTFLFWIVAALDIRINGQRDLERKYWHQYDPTLIAEGIFCFATIMAFLKLLFICQFDYNLGPLQLSLVKMIRDVVHFATIFGIIVIAFTVGLCHLYQYYEGMMQINEESKVTTEQEDSFVNLKSTLRTLFWAIFCMSPMESADVIIENLPGERESETIINYHSFTEFVGYFAFASFQFISVIIVLNMLIACMSNTFTTVTDNVNVEWIFGRTEAYVDVMFTTTLPPPFCVFSIFSGLRPVIEYLKVLINPPPGKRARWNFKNCCYIVSVLHLFIINKYEQSVYCVYCNLSQEDLEEKKDNQFMEIMARLVQRYLRQCEKKIEKDDVQKLRQELKEFSNILKDALSPS
ncbi:short transient receptor potential channel 5 isoform X3 [Cardiocondyla obscurior]|uniref:short transient receptor potential channel 5 isoform X3 n=1 Tax=Cardiocondyla obscurior TaxID=286306 RepID=UPI00396560C1